MRLLSPLATLVLVVLASGCKKSEAATTASGSELFANLCARCHGVNGGGGVPAFAGGPAPRNFHDHEFQSTHTDEQLKLTIKNGKGTAMPAFGNAFDEAQLGALVGHIRSFDPEKGK